MTSPYPWSQPEQLHLNFLSEPSSLPQNPDTTVLEDLLQDDDSDDDDDDDDGCEQELEDLPSGIEFTPQAELTTQCQQLLLALGLQDGAAKVCVEWNSRLSSTAGYASYPSWRIELNPRLAAYPGQVDRTMRHELAHLVAYHRAGRRRIEPHGQEWRQACADLGIPGESARHRLPFPRRQQRRSLAYQCPHCQMVLHRVRPFARDTACRACCRNHAGGRYDARFRLIRVYFSHA